MSNEPVVPTPATAIVISSTAPQGQMIATPRGQPDIIVRVVTPVAAILIRAAKAYMQTLTGLLAAGLTTTALPAKDFVHLVYLCAGLSIASGAMSLLTNTTLLLTALGDKYPTLKS